jgi:energy-coupling factor transporter ATP-binding protein EcfA2
VTRPDSWQVLGIEELAALLADRARRGRHPVRLVAVDGHSASGKTTLAGRLAAALPHAAVLHSDDLAWHHSLFDWRPLLVDGVLRPLWAGQVVDYRPPPWVERGRAGSIQLPAGTETVVLEGVGASRRVLLDLVDTAVWVETDEPERARRDEERIAAGEVTREVYESWMAVENPFLAADQPWLRADAIVAGNSPLPHDPLTQVVVSARPGDRTAETGYSYTD